MGLARGLGPREVAEAAAVVAGQIDDPDPAEMADAFGVAVHAVPPGKLHGCRAQYLRVDGSLPVIQVDYTLRGIVLATAVGHELAHHIVWWWRIDLSAEDEEAFCDAVVRCWLAGRLDRLRGAAQGRDVQALCVQPYQIVEQQRPLHDRAISGLAARAEERALYDLMRMVELR